jgi:excisionase family DNA binding protein
MSEFITPKKAAEFLGISANTLRNWELLKKITAIKTLGGHRRYNKIDIYKIIESNTK